MVWQLHVIGASSTLTPHGDSTASLCLYNGDRAILIDAGGNIPSQLNEAGIDREALTDVIITHSHPDHTYGLPFLSHSFYHDYLDLRCWTTEEAKPRLEKSLDAYDLQESDRYADFEFRTVSSESSEELNLIDDVALRTVPTDHSRPGFGLTMESKDQKIVYSGDTKPTGNLTSLFDTVDVLLHDCQGTEAYKRYFEESHSTAKQIAEIGSKLSVSLLVPFHYNLTELTSTWNEIGDEIRRNFSGSVCYPRKGMGFFL